MSFIGKKHSEETKRKMSLAQKGKIFSEEHLKNMSLSQLGKKASKESKKKMSDAHKGFRHSKESRKKMSVIVQEKWQDTERRKKMLQAHVGMLGKKHSEETRKRMSERERQPHTPQTKQKMRVAAINYIQTTRGNMSPNVGRNEKQILDEQEKVVGHTIQRQFYIKDLGYFVDGYCAKTNTVYEVYEPFHDCQSVQVQRDQQRQQEIQNKLNCKFIIIRDK